ncbi:MAG: hypothetical protein KDD45_01320 [Bdellovibrionales bacterium]|nr:hypothetical protein [Bdellovibrionales bacterium]
MYSLLVGDIVKIETGEIFSVDGIALETNRLHIDESPLTGEPIPVKKYPS